MRINSPAYWDDRFERDWAACGGPEQTAAFMNLLVDLLPRAIGERISRERLEVVDWGCAEGDGVPVLARALPGASVVGVDVSVVAIQRARERFPGERFESIDLTASDRRTDAIVSSNVLEHFADPAAKLEQLADHASSYVVVLVPFLEHPLIDEHEASIDHETFPLTLHDGKRLIFARAIDLRWRRRSPWPGLQILVVYSGRDDAATLGDVDQSAPVLRRRARRARRIEGIVRPLYRAARVDRWLFGRRRQAAETSPD